MTRADQVQELRRTIRISITEGSFAQAFSALVGPGSIFISKFAMMLNATPFQFGLLAAMGQLSMLFQPLGSALTRRLTTRKPAALRLLLAGRLLPLSFGMLPFFLPAELALWGFILAFFIATTFSTIGGNLWIAWISDMIPARLRGRFFSRRTQYLMLAGLAAGYSMGFFIDLIDVESGAGAGLMARISGMLRLQPELLPLGFLMVFTIASALGYASNRFLAMQPERSKEPEAERFGDLVRVPFKDSNFRRLMVYGIWWMLAVGVAAPFWGPFMIEKLKMTMVQIQVYGTISTCSALLALRFWGRFIDRHGNKQAMRIALILGGFNPMVWVLAAPTRYWFVYFEAITSGFMWAGAGIVGYNFVLAIAPKARQQIYSGVFNALSGAAMMLTMLLSGLVLPALGRLQAGSLEPEQVQFAIAGLVRWSTLIPLAWISEPRVSPAAPMQQYLRAATRLLRAQGKQWFHKNGGG
ncbi:MFS transporter [bacterium]|nr:MFS transporter [candidate division CSSED10-310 bacterium]